MNYIYTTLDWIKYQLLNPVIRDIPTASAYIVKCLIALFLVTLLVRTLVNLLLPKGFMDKEARASVCNSAGVIGSMAILFGATLCLINIGKIRTYWELGCLLLLYITLIIVKTITTGPANNYENKLAKLRN